jgi:hypothetical protein
MLAILLAAGSAFAQDAQQEPSRKELLERDGIIWASPAAWIVPFQENLGEDAKIAGLSRLWMEVKINFPHFAEVADLDWDKTYVDFIPKVRATTSTYEYYRLLQQMCALLKDGHSGVFLPKELAERMEADLPLRIDLIENRVFVTRVESKALEAEGVAAGLEILNIAYNILGYLTAGDFATPPWKSRDYIPTLRVWGQAGGWFEPKPIQWAGKGSDAYLKPVVMLIGPRSLSATDVFAETFKDLQRGKLVGEATAGSTGDPLAFALPGGGSARVATSTDTGAGIIGKGVQPDILVPRTVRDFLAGHDAALAVGIAALRSPS